MIGKARFTVLAAECIRLEYGAFTDEPSLFAVNRDTGFKEFQTRTRGNQTVVETRAIRLTFIDDGKPFHSGNLQAVIHNSIEWKPGMANRRNLGGTIRTLDGIREPVDLGEGLLSRDGWYLLDDSRRPLFTKDWVMSRPKDRGTDWYLFGYGTDFKAALRAMTQVGGAIPLPRRYALGAWYSRYWPYRSKEYREIVKEYTDHDFPLDVIVLDMDWHKEGWTGWSWNRELLPDAEKLLAWFHEQGLFVTLNVHPADGVGPHEDMYDAFMLEMDRDPSKKETLPFDAGDRKYLEALFKHTHVPLEKAGIDFWWLDWQQVPYTRSIPDLTNLQWLNHYYFRHTGRGDRRGISFSRWAGWGDHRYPIQFSGDAYTDFVTLAFQVPFTSTAGNVGCFFWSHDIGGHQGSRNEESYVRWVQFGATTAALRSHSERNKDLDRRPWTYSKQAEESMRRSFHLRAQIFPYLYSSVWQCAKDALPLNRPMYLEHPELDAAFTNPQQYYFGDAMLAAPIVTPGAGPQKISWQTAWFPSGVWYHWFTGEKFTGGTDTIVAGDIHEFPLFARGGTPIPLQPHTLRMTTEPLRELVVRAFPGEKGAFTLYEDDGISKDYLRGEHATTVLSYARDGGIVAVTVAPTQGSFKGQLKKRAVVVELAATRKARKAWIDGREADVEYDEETFVNRIRVPERSIADGVTVKVQVEEIDSKVARDRAMIRRLRGLLGEGAVGLSLRDVVRGALQKKPDPATLEALLAVCGIAAHRKNEGAYLYRGPERTVLHNAMGLADDDAFRATVVDRVGSIESEHAPLQAGPGALSEPPLPEPKLGVGLVRTLRIDMKVLGEPVTLIKPIVRSESFISRWKVAGPFDFDPKKSLSRQKFPPEEGRWDSATAASANEKGAVDLRKHFDADDKIAYAAATIVSERDQDVVLKIRSDDGAVAWLNEKRIYASEEPRSMEAAPDTVKATLRAGKNLLLVKISQHGGAWAFGVGIETSEPVTEE